MCFSPIKQGHQDAQGPKGKAFSTSTPKLQVLETMQGAVSWPARIGE